ncbi:MAG: PstS family phosphate ABC transporter substrate-binding protein [Kovacikia sp.]
MLLLVLGLLSLTAGCKANSQASQNSVQIDGSSTVYPITQLAVTKFNAGESNRVSMTVRQAGTEAGFKSFCAGETAINEASRPILLREIDACKQNNVRYVELPIAFDALTVVVNAKNSWANDITTTELKTLWEPAAERKIKTWNQIRAGWPNQPIHLYGPDKNSGTIDYFTLALGLPEHGIRSDYIGNSDARVLAQKVGNDPAAFGYFGYGVYLTNTNHLKSLAIDSGKGAVLPSLETVNNTRYQPFSRPLLLYVNIQSAQVNPNVKAFVEYYLGHTRELVKEVGYFPLPEEAYHMNSVHFYNAKVGTVFAGAPEPGITIPQLLRKQAIF